MKRKTTIAFCLSLLLMFAVSLKSNTAKAQIPSSYIEGYFYHDLSNDYYFWFCKGKLRHILTEGTLKGLFVNVEKNTWTANTLGPNAPYGGDLGPNNGLIRDTNTDKIYFLRDGYIHYITSPAVFDQYHFNVNTVRNVTGITGYRLCGTLPEQILDISCPWN